MARSLRLGGHPLHPLLVHFPIALWTVAVAADVAGWISGQALWWMISFGSQALGVLMATLAMLAGFLDYLTIARHDPAQDTAVRHMMAMSTAWLLFLVSLALRGVRATDLSAAAAPPGWATVAAIGGFLAMALGGWLGGQLVYRFGVGVRSSTLT